MNYRYIAFDKSGNKIKGTVEASSINEAKTKLENLYIIEIKPVKNSMANKCFIF